MHLILELNNLKEEDIESMHYDSETNSIKIKTKKIEQIYKIFEENGTFLLKYEKDIYATNLLCKLQNSN